MENVCSCCINPTSTLLFCSSRLTKGVHWRDPVTEKSRLSLVYTKGSSDIWTERTKISQLLKVQDYVTNVTVLEMLTWLSWKFCCILKSRIGHECSLFILNYLLFFLIDLLLLIFIYLLANDNVNWSVIPSWMIYFLLMNIMLLHYLINYQLNYLLLLIVFSNLFLKSF